MEVASALLRRTCLVGVDIVETIGPVDTHQTHHGEEDTYAETGRALHLEGVEVLGICPGITAFEEAETVDGGVAQHERIAELEGEAVVGVGVV